MVHIDPDFETKKAFKDAVKSGESIMVYSPGPFPAPTEGRTVVEAPARYHKWYASVIVKNGYVIKVVG